MSMEFDLEMPSGDEEKLDSALDTNTIGEENEIYVSNGNASENVDGMNENVNEKGIVNCEPQKDLEFETKEAAYSFYREYARSVGFGITIKASRRSKKSGKFIDVKIACSRFGSKRESSTTANSRSCPKTGCKASLHLKRRHDGKWYIYSFVKEHNHEICPDDFDCAIRGKGKKSPSVACQKKGLQLALDEGDVQILLDYLSLSQAETPNFYYALDFDSERRMRNVFWIDGKSRHDYLYFSDVVLFDTTYVRNKYKIPLVPIVGVNHHFQFMLLGCALVGEDTTSSFAWLMRTWLRAVGGRSPLVVITDNDKAMKEATSKVFPLARHYFYLWNVLTEISDKLSHKMNTFEDFKKNFNKCMYSLWEDEEFEKGLWILADQFELRDDECMQSLLEEHRKWAPIYMRGVFLGGLSSIERSGSVSSFFDKYISDQTTLKEFIVQYKVYLIDRYKKEAETEFEIQRKQPILKSISPFEKQMSTIYTPSVFKKFQDEVLGVASCNLHKEGEEVTTITFRVDDSEKHENFLVEWNVETTHVFCSCHLYEYRGFLCRHALIVLQTCGISNIASHYILKRWTRDAMIREYSSIIPRTLHFRVQRFNDLHKIATKLGEEGCLLQETYELAVYALEESLKQCVLLNNSVMGTLETNENTMKEKNETNMAKASKKKKVVKKRKVPSEDAISLGAQDTNLQMRQLNSRALTLEEACASQHDVQAMDSGSRAVNDYYSAQESIQGLGRLSTLSSMGDGYYDNQQSLQTYLRNLNFVPTRLGHYASQQSVHGPTQLGFRTPSMHGCFDIRYSLPDIENSVNIPTKDMHNKHPSQ